MTRTTLCLFVLFLARFAAAAEPIQPAALRAKVDELAEQLLAAEESAGLVVGVETPQGREFFAYGRVRDGQDQRPDEHTLFEIGSITKTFTALTLADMVARGEVSLVQPIKELLPSEVKVPKRGEGEITLEHLATHTSGLPRMPSNFAPADPLDPYADYTPERLYAYLTKRADRKGKADPQWSYSNLGMGLLGHALALKAGKPYEELVDERVWQPLGLDETAITLTPEQQQRFAQGHNSDGAPTNAWALGALQGAGAIRSSADDLLDYMAAHVKLRETPLKGPIEEVERPRAKVDEHQQSGLAWLVSDQGFVSHNGQTGGFHASALGSPAEQVAVVVLANQASGQIDALADRILLLALGKEAPPLSLKQTVAVPSDVLAEYAGRYKLGSGAVFTVRSDGQKLYAELTGQPEFRLFPESETKFFYRAVDAQITFERDADGKVTALMLHQNGDHRAPRMVE